MKRRWRLPAAPDAGEAVERSRSWRPGPIFRYRELDGPGQVVFLGILVLLAVMPVLSAVIVLTQGWRPAGDNALIGLRVHDVITGHFPLIGQPTTGENFGSGIPTSHPGPIEFYLVAPFSAILGPRIGLALGAALINSVAMVGTGWLAFRRGGLGLMGLGSLASLAMARSLGGNLLHDPVSSNVGAMLALTLLFAAWSVLAGDLRTVPVFVLAGTFALQDHLTYLGTGAPVVALAIGVGIWWIVRTSRRSNADWLKRRLVISGVVGLVLWLPVFIDEIFGAHNLTAIFRTFTGKRTAGEGLHFALGRLAEALAPMPVFARQVGPLGYLHKPATHEWVLGYLVLAAIIGFGIWFWRQRRTELASLAVVAVLAAMAGTYTAMKLPVGAGIQASNLRWMWTVSAFCWVALAWMVWSVAPAFWREVIQAPVLVAAGVATVLLTTSLVGSIGMDTDRDGTTAEASDTLIRHVKEALPKGTYRVAYAGGSVVVSVGPALVHDLDYRGDTILMDVGPFTRAYADHRAYEEQPVDGTILVTAEANASYPPGTKLLARQSFEVNRKDGAVNIIRVYLVAGDGS